MFWRIAEVPELLGKRPFTLTCTYGTLNLGTQLIKFEGERDNRPSGFHAECPQLDNSWWTIGAFQTPFDLSRCSSKRGSR